MEKMPSSFNREPATQLEQAESRVKIYRDNHDLYDDIMNSEEIARKSGYASFEDYAKDSELLYKLQTGEITEEEAKTIRQENIEEAKEDRHSNSAAKRHYFAKRAGRASLSSMSRMLNDVADAKHRELDKMRKDLAKEEAEQEQAEQEKVKQAEEPQESQHEDTEQTEDTKQ